MTYYRGVCPKLLKEKEGKYGGKSCEGFGGGSMGNCVNFCVAGFPSAKGNCQRRSRAMMEFSDLYGVN